MAMRKWVRQQDLFGHPILLNFNHKGTAHTTLFGGFFSLIIKALMVAYFSMLIKRLVLHEQDDLSTQLVKNELLDPLQLENGGFALLLSIQIAGTPVNLQSVRKYFEITQSAFIWDFTPGTFVLEANKNPKPLPSCSEQHFSGQPDLTRLYEDFKNFDANCVDFTGLELEGAMSALKGSTMNLRFKKCVNSTSFSECAPQEEIDRITKQTTFTLMGGFEQIDFRKRDPTQNPTYAIMDKLLAYTPLENGLSANYDLELRPNKFELDDSYFSIGFPSSEGVFYDFARVTREDYPTSTELLSGALFQIQLSMSRRMQIHSRNSYGLLDLIGDLGGVLEVLMSVGAFIGPISSHSFLLKALEKLYLVRSEDTHLTEPVQPQLRRKNSMKVKYKPSKVPIPSELRQTSVEEEVRKHRPIKVSEWSKTKLYLRDLCCWTRCWVSKKTKRLQRLLEKGGDRLEKEMSLEYLLKSLRDLRILVKEKILQGNDLLKFEIQHNHRNVIEVDTSSGPESEGERSFAKTESRPVGTTEMSWIEGRHRQSFDQEPSMATRRIIK